MLSPRGWDESYRHQEILEAFALAYSELPHPTILLFIALGRGTSEEAKLYHQGIFQVIDKLKIKDHVKILPPMSYEMMPYVYALADVVINYPINDAFPSTIIEAVACERPVITAQLPGYKGTFIEEFCTLVDANNMTELAKAMAEVVNTPRTNYSSQIAKARQVIVEQYDESIFKNRLFNLYKNLMI